MDVVPLSFISLKLCGMWYEESETLSLPKIIYRLIVILAIFYFTLTQTAELLLKEHDIHDFTESLFLTLICVSLCMKTINFVYRRTEMIILLRDFRSDYCKPLDDHESGILKSNLRMTKKIFILLIVMALLDFLTFVGIFIIKVFNNVMELPYKVYHFYDLSNCKVFFSTSLLQIFTMVYSICLNISFDTMTAGFLIMITGQFKLNAYRLSNLNEKNIDKLNSYIVHNQIINSAVDKIQSFFIWVVIPFFLFSLLSICSTIFQVSQNSIISFKFLSLAVFVMCILFQVFLYCWFGNELKLKSTAVFDAVYNSNWIPLNSKARKSIHIIMMCTKEGRTVSYSGQCALTLDTFVWILKTCYATLNLLQHMST